MSGTWRAIEGKAGELRVYLSEEPSAGPTIVLCPDLPRNQDGSPDSGRGYPLLVDRLASECACRCGVGMLRGMGGSPGDFSANGWLDDLESVFDAVAGEASERSARGTNGGLLVIGFGLGGALALRAATFDARVLGVASISAVADLSAWNQMRGQVLSWCARSGVIRTPGYPKDEDAWFDELVALAPLEAAGRLGERPLLVVHGSEDSEVPVAAARAIADAATTSAVDLHIVPGGGHLLRADPRVLATLVGWVERCR